LSLDDDEGDNAGVAPEPSDRVNSTVTFEIPTVYFKPSRSSSSPPPETSSSASGSKTASASPSNGASLGPPIHNGGDWYIKINHHCSSEDDWTVNWTLIDSNGNEASHGDSSSGDNKDRKYVISCFNRPLIDRLPFGIVMDVNNPQKKNQAKFSFMIDFNMPKNCKAGWWTGTTDGKN
jgi:hypothetical protein